MGGLKRYRVLLRVRRNGEDQDELLLRVVWAGDAYDAASTAEIIARREDQAELKRWIGVEEYPFAENQPEGSPR